MEAYSRDLSKGVLMDGGGSVQYGQDQPALVPGEPANNPNLFLRDNTGGSYQLIDVTPPGATPALARFQQASSDLSHVVFEEDAQLTPDSPAGASANFYDWSGGSVHLLSILPDGSAVPPSLEVRFPHIGRNNPGVPVLDNHSVSADGSRIFFEVHAFAVQDLYLRENDTTTVQVDASHGSGPGGGGEFAVASSDGSKAFFLDADGSGLTNDTVSGSGTNLYRYDTNGGTLTDLTPAAHAEVLGVLGASEDGSYIYFVANGVLAPGASPGHCTGGSESAACNLYVSHDGSTTFIATLNDQDVGDWHETIGGVNNSAIVSPDGRYLAFQSLNSLTGYDNLKANGAQCGTDSSQLRCTEVFLYDADGGPAGKLNCASCNPSGGAPAGASLISRPGVTEEGLINYEPRYLSDSGRLFFNSLDALVPQDVNAQWDVYEFEPGGIGGCEAEQGCISPISPGTSKEASTFIDASDTGEDVFFVTSEPLVAQDGDQSADLYDAKVNGGLESQNEGPASSCAGEACKPPASRQPGEQAASSGGLAGPGNLTPSPAVAVRGKAPTRAQRLAAALRLCKSKPKRKRPSCIAQAKRRYGAGTKTKKTKRAKRARNDRRAGK